MISVSQLPSCGQDKAMIKPRSNKMKNMISPQLVVHKPLELKTDHLMYARLSPAASTATTRSGLQLYIAVQVRKSAEGRAPVAMQLVQLLQLVFF